MRMLQAIRAFASKPSASAPKKVNRTPVGALEEIEDKEEAPKRRIVNEETGEVGGPQGPEPTRFGDWERKGRVSDF